MPIGPSQTDEATIEQNVQIRVGLSSPSRNSPRPVVPGYEILKELGRGGMGVVYLARQIRLNRSCALKMILSGGHADAISLVRFLAEAEAVARIRHPNVVQIHHIGEADGLPYIEFEYLKRASLDRNLDGTPWPSDRAAALVEGLARGVAEAHRLGIVHRDLKPGNVLLEDDDTPKITDFGLAKSIGLDGGLTQTESILGSPSYMAPEQASGRSREVGPACDIYALGAILYELLAGRPPFKAATILQTLELVKTAEPVPPSRFQIGLPRDIETIALTCLRKEPGRRYVDASAMAEDLRRFRTDQPILARRASPAERLVRWCRRNPALAIVTGLAASAMIVATLLSIALAIHQANAAAILAREQQKTVLALTESRRITANLTLDKGIALAERGEVGHGLLWQSRALLLASEAGDVPLQRAIRMILAGWLEKVYPLVGMLAHPGEVTSIAFSPDGKSLISGGKDGTARIWELASESPTIEPLRHPKSVLTVAFSPDGRLALTGCADGVARLWDAATGSLLSDRFRREGPVVVVAFRPDGRAILTAAETSVVLWDLGGQPIGLPFDRKGSILAASFHPDGRSILTARADGTAQRWEIATGSTIGEEIRHKSQITSGAFSPDGKTILTGGWDSWAQFWDAETGRSISTPIAHRDTLLAVAFSGDGLLAMTGGFDNTVRLWDAKTHRPIGQPLLHNGAVHALAASTAGKTIASACFHGPIRLWRASVPLPSFEIRHVGEIVSVAISSDARTVITAGMDRTIRLSDATDGRQIGESIVEKDTVYAVAFSPDSRSFLSANKDGSLQVRDRETRRVIAGPLKNGSIVYAAAFHPEGRLIVSGGRDGIARVWDRDTGQPVGKPMPHPNWVHSVVFSPDGRTILTGCEDGQARFWDSSTMEPIGRSMISPEAVRCVAFHPEGRSVLTGCWDGTTRFWDVATGNPLGVLQQHTDRVMAIAFRPDGRSFAVGLADGSTRIWDVATSKPLTPPDLSKGQVRAVAFHPDGHSVMSGSFDGTARFHTIPNALEGSDESVRLSVELLTGKRLDDGDAVISLDPVEWRSRRDRLKRLGGTPTDGRDAGVRTLR